MKEDADFAEVAAGLVYRFRTCMPIITTDWNSKTAPKSLLDRNWLRLTPNALADGQWYNEYISVRDGSPYLTNNLQKPPVGKVEKKAFSKIVFSRIVQCEY